MAYGFKGHFGISRQESFGTATASMHYFPVISETLTTAIEQLQEEGNRGSIYEPPSHGGLITVAGDVVFEPDPLTLGNLLRAVTGQASSTAVDSAFQWDFLPKQTDFTPEKTALPPYTLEVFRDTTKAWQFTDSVLNQLTVEIGANALVRCTASFMCRVSSLATKSVPSYTDDDRWKWYSTSISIAGTANADLENITLTYNNNIEGVVTNDATRLYNRFLRSTWLTVGANGTFAAPSETEYGVFRADNEQRMIVTATGATTAESYTNELIIDLPKLRYTSYPVNMSGPGRTTVGFDGNAKEDVSSAYAVKFTLTNTVATY